MKVSFASLEPGAHFRLSTDGEEHIYQKATPAGGVCVATGDWQNVMPTFEVELAEAPVADNGSGFSETWRKLKEWWTA